MGAPLKVAALLDQVHRRVHPLGPPDYLAAETILRSRDDWTHGDLRASLASLLAHDAEQWKLIAKIYDEVVVAAYVTKGESADLPGSKGLLRFAVPSATVGSNQNERLHSALKRFKRFDLLSLILVVVVIGAGLFFWRANRIGVEEPMSVSQANSIEAAPTRLFPEYRLEIIEDGHQAAEQDAEVREPMPDSLLVTLVLISATLMTLGCRLISVLPAVEAQRLKEIAERQDRTNAERKRLEEEKAAAGKALEVRYQVKKYLPISLQATLDSSEILGRLSNTTTGYGLDSEATLQRTIEAGGRFTPMPDARVQLHELVVLVDVEEGNHPWLNGFLRVLEAWKTQGVRLLCYEFHMNPDSLVDLASGRPLLVDELARRTEGLSLLVFSRQLDLTGREGEAKWIGQLNAWARCGWLDPDPRGPDRLAPPRKQVIFQLQRLGLPRFHLSDRGLVGLASWLKDRGGDRPGRSELALPHHQDDPKLAEALRQWALVASLVPDPSWDQLDAIRRHIPELFRVLPEPRFLQCLLEWVEERTGLSAELGGGRGLAIPRRQQQEWLMEQRQLEAKLRPEVRLENRARQLLLDQLKDTRPKNSLDLEWWKFKNAMHRAVLEPNRSADLLEWVYSSPIAYEATQLVESELRQHELNSTLALWSKVNVRRLQVLQGSRGVVKLGVLALGHGRLWWHSLVIPGLLGLAFFSVVFIGENKLATAFFEREIRQIVTAAPVYKLEETDLPPEANPEMVMLPAGEFMMGSKDGIPDEQPVHRVSMRSFQISKTEITVKQYQACVEAEFCEAPEAGEACNWGRAERDQHPVNCVSWQDAMDFAKWAGARLPSEAEWEYAARSAGQARLYPWGDEPANCNRAVIRVGDVYGCGEAGTWPVCSKTTGNTENGLCDLAGNVGEWVEDTWRANYSDAPRDGTARFEPSTDFRVVRGGSWGSDSQSVESAYRLRFGFSGRDEFIGFRVARSYSRP